MISWPPLPRTALGHQILTLNLTLPRLVLGCRMESFGRMMQTCTKKWDRAQQRQQRITGKRDYKVHLRVNHWYSDPTMDALGTISSDVSSWASIREVDRTQSNKHRSFRMAARLAASVHALIVQPESCFPFLLFKLLDSDDPARIDSIAATLREAPCRLDPVSKEYLERYPTLDALVTKAARAELIDLAMTLELCIARIEGQWARVRRLTKIASLQSPTPDVSAVSASFVHNSTRDHRAATEKLRARPTFAGTTTIRVRKTS